MKKIKRYFNKLQIYGFAIATILIILVLFVPNDILKGLYWLAIETAMLGSTYFLKKWSADGITWFRKNDKNYYKNVNRKYSEIIMAIVGALVIVFTIAILQSDETSKNYWLMLGTYLFSLIVLIALFYLTDKKYEQMERLIPKKK